jgi:putative transposase
VRQQPDLRSAKIERDVADFFVVPTATYRLLFVLVLLAHDRRRIVHIAVTANPTAAWSHCTCDGDTGSAHSAGRSWQNTYVERFIGSARRECLDHVIVLSAAGLRRLLKDYVEYYTSSRTHLAIEKEAPVPRPIAPPPAARVIAIPQVGGLHHRYERRAA